MFRLSTFIGIIFLCFGLMYVNAQEPFHLNYTNENGLIDNEVYDLHQDKNGYIWIAGNSGVQRFDGQRFVTYTSPQKKSASLAELCEDTGGRIWMHDFTDRIFYAYNDSLALLKNYQSATGTFPTIYCHKNTLWINASDKISCYTLTKTGAELKKTITLNNSRVTYTYKNKTYCVTPTNVVCFDEYFKPSTLTVNIPKGSNALTSWCAFFELENELYLLTLFDKCVYKLNHSTFEKYTCLPISSDLIGVRVIQNACWVLTRAGAYCFDHDFLSYKHYLSNYPISDILEDKDHSLWMSTLTQGVFYIPNTQVTNNTKHGGFSAIKQWQNQVYLGGIDGNIYRFSNEKISLLHATQKRKEIGFIYHHAQTQTTFWGNASLVKSTQQKKAKEFASNPGTKQLEALDKNWFLCSSSDGLMLMQGDLNTKSTPPNWLLAVAEPIQKSAYFKYRIIPARTQQFYLNQPKKYVLAITKNGVYKVTEQGKELLHYNHEPIYATSITGHGDSVWIATLSNGILFYYNGNLTAHQSITNDLLSNQLQKISYQQGCLLVIHAKGLQVFDLIKNKTFNFLQSDGIYKGNIHEALLYNNQVYLVNSNGLTTFPLTLTYAATTSPQVYINTINGKKSNLTLTQYLTENNKLNIAYSLVGFKYKDWTKVRYKIEGYETDWNENTFDAREINYNALPYGNYWVLIQAVNEANGTFSDVVKIPVQVKAPFYKSIYFILAMALLALVLVWYLMQLRIKKLAQKNKELLEKERINKELKSSMLASIKSQMNPHFIFNALNTIQSYVLQNDKLQANFYLGKFSDLMRRILNMSARDNVKLEEEIESIKLYLELENMRFNGQLNYQIVLPENDELLDAEIPSMIIQPYVENAIKHGLLHKSGTKNLVLTFNLFEPKIIKVTVKDNGIGRQQAAQMKARAVKHATSFSSEANRKRLELLNEQLTTKIGLEIIDEFDGIFAAGTTVIMYIPYQ